MREAKECRVRTRRQLLAVQHVQAIAKKEELRRCNHSAVLRGADAVATNE